MKEVLKARKQVFLRVLFSVLILVVCHFAPSSAIAEDSGPFDEGLVAQWHFDGNADDSSGNDNNGTVYSASYVNGKFGQALSFDGQDRYVEVPDDDSLDIIDEITIEAWVETSNAAPLGTNSNPGLSAKHILDNCGSTGDGTYWVDLDGAGGDDPVEVYCDMDDGGWTRLNNNIASSTTLFNNDDVLITNNVPGGCGSPGYAFTISNIIANHTNVRIYLTRTTSIVQCAGIVGVPAASMYWNGGDWVSNGMCTWGDGIFANACCDPTNMTGLKLLWKLEGTKAANGEIKFKSECSGSSDNGLIKATVWVGGSTIIPSAGISKADAYGLIFDNTTLTGKINNQTIVTSIPIGWNHIVMTYKNLSSNQQKLYVNGKLKIQGTLTDAISINANNLTIGNYFNGIIDEVSIWNRALNENEVAEIYAAPSELKCEDLTNPTAVSDLTPEFSAVFNDREPGDIADRYRIQVATDFLDDVLGLWHFNEQTGTMAYDESSNSHNGTVIGASWVNGKFGKALSFDGVNDCVSVPTIPLTSTFTHSAWINTDSVSVDQADRQYIYTQQKDPPDPSYYTYQQRQGFQIAGDLIDCQYWDGSGCAGISSASGSIEAGNWYYIVFTGDSSGGKLYINGDLVDSNPIVPVTISITEGFIGRRGDSQGEDYFNGTIDEVRTLSRALSPEEVKGYYLSGHEHYAAMWDSGTDGTSMGIVSEGSRCANISYDGTPIYTDGSSYQWRIKFWDDAGNEGPWSEAAFFAMLDSVPSAPGDLQVEGETNPAGVAETAPDFSGIFNDPEVGDQAYYYQLELWLGDRGKYRRTVTIDNTGNGDFLVDYQVRVDLEAEGFDYSRVNADGSDLRFQDEEGNNLPYWIESWRRWGDSAVWVRVPEIPAFSVQTINLYYGNPTASNCSDGPATFLHFDGYDAADTAYWTFDGYQTVPYNLSGENILRMWGSGGYQHYQSRTEDITAGVELFFDFQRTGVSSWHIGAVENANSYNRWCIQEDNLGNIRVQSRVNGGAWVNPKQLITAAKTNTWYTGLLRVWEGGSGFYMKVWEKDNPAVYGDFSYSMPAGLTWRFHSWMDLNMSGYHDNFRIRRYTSPDPAVTVNDDEESALIWDSGMAGLEPVTAGETFFLQYGGPDLLTDGSNYYWQIRFWDAAGNEGQWSEMNYFTMLTSVPLAPTDLLCESHSDPAGVTDLTPEFSAVFNDPESEDIADQYRIQVRLVDEGISGIWHFTRSEDAGLDFSLVSPPQENGITRGYLAGDLKFTPNFWGGAPNAGEFGIAGTYLADAAGNHPAGVLNYGVACVDENTGMGYIMYSAQSVHTRFAASPPIVENAEHFVGVRHNGSNWQYDNNTAWVNFTPVATDILVAAVDFSNDRVTALETPPVRDSSRNGNHGVRFGAVPTEGKSGDGLWFDGTDDYLHLRGDFDPGEMSLSFWVYTDAAQSWDRRFDIVSGTSSGGNGRFLLYKEVATPLRFYLNFQDVVYYQEIPDAVSIFAGKWAHVAMVSADSSRGGMMRVYVNGEGGAAIPVGHLYNYLNQDLYLMSNRGGAYFTRGKVDGVAVFNRALTEEEVGELYLQGTDYDYPMMWESGVSGDAMSGVPEGSRCGEIVYGGDRLYTDGAGYQWRIKFWDAAGNEGAWSESAYFTMLNSIPSAPTELNCDEESDPVGLTDLTPGFCAVYNDREPGDSAVYYQVQAANDAGFGALTWETGMTAMAELLDGESFCLDYTGDLLIFNGESYYWRIRFWDQDGNTGDWSEAGMFTMADYDQPPSPPTGLLCRGEAAPVLRGYEAPDFSAVYNDPDPADQAVKYWVQVSEDPGFGSVFWESGASGTAMGNVLGGERCGDISPGVVFPAGAKYYWRIKFWDLQGYEGEWSVPAVFTLVEGGSASGNYAAAAVGFSAGGCGNDPGEKRGDGTYRLVDSLGMGVVSSGSSGAPYISDSSGRAYFEVLFAALDTIAPSIPGEPAAGESPTYQTRPAWEWADSLDNFGGSGLREVAGYRIWWSQLEGGEDYSAWVDSNSYTHQADLGLGAWYLKVRAADREGNLSAASSSGLALIVTPSPTPSITPTATPSPTASLTPTPSVTPTAVPTATPDGGCRIDLTVYLHGYLDETTLVQRPAAVNVEFRTVQNQAGDYDFDLELDSAGRTGEEELWFLPPDNYYLLIRQKLSGETFDGEPVPLGANHYPAVSSQPRGFIEGVVTEVNFSDFSAPEFIGVYVSSHEQASSPLIASGTSGRYWMLGGGNADGNDLINVADILKWDTLVGFPDADDRGEARFSEQGNFDGSAKIDGYDFNIWKRMVNEGATYAPLP